MKTVLVLGLMVTMSIFTHRSVLGQSNECREDETKRDLIGVEEHPPNAIDYSNVAAFKLISRKSSYRIDEMISIDMAILNRSNGPVFFSKFTGYNLTVTATNESGAEIRIGSLYIYSGRYFGAIIKCSNQMRSCPIHISCWPVAVMTNIQNMCQKDKSWTTKPAMARLIGAKARLIKIFSSTGVMAVWDCEGRENTQLPPKLRMITL